MSVLVVKLQKSEASNTVNDSTERRTYVIQCSAASDTASTACAASGIPQIGDTHPTNSLMTCIHSNASFVTDSTYVFVVDAVFSTAQDDEDADVPYPWDEQPDMEGGGVEFIYPFSEDLEGATVINTAGDSFDPLPTSITYDTEITITKNFQLADTDRWDLYRGAVNSDTFTIVTPDGLAHECAPGEVKMGNIKWSWQRKNGYGYARATFPLMIRKITDESPQPWKRRILNEGYNERVGGTIVDGVATGGTKRHIKLDDNKDCASPQKLNLVGARITNDDAVLLEFTDYFEWPFDLLGLMDYYL